MKEKDLFTDKVTIKLTPKMREDIENLAVMYGLNLSTYIRMILVKEVSNK